MLNRNHGCLTWMNWHFRSSCLFLMPFGTRQPVSENRCLFRPGSSFRASHTVRFCLLRQMFLLSIINLLWAEINSGLPVILQLELRIRFIVGGCL